MNSHSCNNNNPLFDLSHDKYTTLPYNDMDIEVDVAMDIDMEMNGKYSNGTDSVMDYEVKMTYFHPNFNEYDSRFNGWENYCNPVYREGPSIGATLPESQLTTPFEIPISMQRSPCKQFYKERTIRRRSDTTPRKMSSDEENIASKHRELSRVDRNKRNKQIESNNTKIGEVKRVVGRGNFKLFPHSDFLEEELKIKTKFNETEIKLKQLQQEYQILMSNRLSRTKLQLLETQQKDVNTIKKQLQQQLKKLKNQKVEHTKDCRLWTLQNESPFYCQPIFAQRYFFCKLIGKGGFGEIWKVFDIKNNRHYAAKLFNSYKAASDEYLVLSDLKHEHIVKVNEGIIKGDNAFSSYYAIVMEYVHSSLENYLHLHGSLNEIEAQRILMEIMAACYYLEIQGVVHMDLKPGNILMTKSGKVKLADFGLSETPTVTTLRRGGTFQYLPPEYFRSNLPLNICSKIDVWAIGIIFFQLLFGYTPFQTDDVKMALLTTTEIEIPDYPPISPLAKSFLERCLAYEQEDRPTLDQLIVL